MGMSVSRIRLRSTELPSLSRSRLRPPLLNPKPKANAKEDVQGQTAAERGGKNAGTGHGGRKEGQEG